MIQYKISDTMTRGDAVAFSSLVKRQLYVLQDLYALHDLYPELVDCDLVESFDSLFRVLSDAQERVLSAHAVSGRRNIF